jgi:hypothetical protein
MARPPEADPAGIPDRGRRAYFHLYEILTIIGWTWQAAFMQMKKAD